MYTCDKCEKTFLTMGYLNRHRLQSICTKINIYTCEKCNATYDKYISWYSHVKKNNCILIAIPAKKTLNKNNNNNYDEKFENMLKEMEIMKQTISDLKMEKTKNNTEITNIMNQNTNILNQNTNIMNQNNINNNVVILSKFGNEDLSKLTDNELYQILKGGLNVASKLVEKLHFNKNLPENHNILFKNLNNKYGEIYNGDDWISQQKNDIINDLFDNNKFLIDSIDKNSLPYKNLNENIKKRINEVLEADNDSEIAKNIKEDLRLLVYNNKNIVLKTRYPKKLK